MIITGIIILTTASSHIVMAFLLFFFGELLGQVKPGRQENENHQEHSTKEAYHYHKRR